MSRRKGQIDRRQLQRLWPHHVALPAEAVCGAANSETVRGLAGALSVAPQDQRAAVGGREVDVEHLDGGELVEYGPRGEAGGQRLEPVSAFTIEGEMQRARDLVERLLRIASPLGWCDHRWFHGHNCARLSRTIIRATAFISARWENACGIPQVSPRLRVVFFGIEAGEQIEIMAGDQQAVVVEVGGGLRSYSASGRDLVDGYGAHEMSSSGRGQALIPWPNRLQDGSYAFDGRRHQVPLNEPERRNAIHGLVRWVAWTASNREPHRVVMEHVLHPQPGYPFSLRLRIEYSLSDSGLRVRTTATNIGTDRCPYGSGAHPYLALGTPTVDPLILHVPARTVLRSDERGLPMGKEAVEGTEYDFRKPRRIGSTMLDHAFTHLERDEDGLARVELQDPEHGTQVCLWVDESSPYLMLFSGDPLPDVHRRSLAVEPMTCPPNAFRSGDALIVLEPGSSFTSTWGIARGSTNRR
jgi:aldose 1-epimerase